MEETSFIVKYPNEEDHKNHITNEVIVLHWTVIVINHVSKDMMANCT